MNVREFIQILLTVALRRWLVILLPIILFSGFGVLAVKYWPRTFEARTLIMLQEGQAADPLNYGGRAARRTQLRGAALDTLLKSERVLRGAILDFNLGQEPLSPKKLEAEIKSLRREIFVGVVGQEFIEIELRQSDPVGLADRLSIIVTRFLERLLSRKDAMKTARQFALEQRKRDLEHAEKTLAEWFERHQALIANEQIKADVKRIAALQKTRSEAEQKLIDAAGPILQGPVELTNIVATLAQARQFPLGATSGVGPQRTAQVKRLEVLFEYYEGLNTSLVQAQRASVAAVQQSLQSAQSASGPVYQELQSLEARYNEAVEQYTAHRAQANKSKAPALPPFGLINPELIRIIDEPYDPVSPTSSVLKIVLACLAAGIGLGVGLAALAEQIDDTLYDAGGLNRLSGIDVVIPLPKMDPQSKELDRIYNPDADERTSLEPVHQRA
ncbi:MAG: hypothetical protein ACR2PA_17030 [Hyphomicrobiaceae bacterium]